MSLPIVVIFERHWDPSPKHLVRDLFPKLAAEGYDTFCFEAPQNLPFSVIRDRKASNIKFATNLLSQAEACLRRSNIVVKEKLSDVSYSILAELFRQHVSSKKYLFVAEQIINLPASHLLDEIFKDTDKLSFMVEGIDADNTIFDQIDSDDLQEKVALIKKHESARIEAMTDNLSKLHKKRGGIIFLCGAAHADNLIKGLRDKNINLKQDVIHLFPHSERRLDYSIDDIQEVLMSETLKEQTFCIDTKSQISTLSDRVISEIKSKNICYKAGIIENNSHAVYFSQLFKVNFVAMQRGGYHVDVVLSEDQVNDDILGKLKLASVKTSSASIDGINHLVISNVNTKSK